MSDVFDIITRFHNLVTSMGYGITEDFDTNPYRFCLDPYSGTLFVIDNPAVIMQVIELASQVTEGEHYALLALITERKSLSKPRVHWGTPANLSEETGYWITLRTWLTENGQNPNELYPLKPQA